jgi:ketosteroid isomerase-like protein
MGSTTALVSEAEAAIRRMDAEFIENFRNRDVIKLVNDFYAEDARVLPSNRPALTGRQAIIGFWEGALATGLTDARLNTTHVDAAGDLAYAVGEFTMQLPDRVLRGKYTVIYRRQTDGLWKAVVDMFSPNE